MNGAIKRLLPYWMRIGAKLVLARLPVGYSLWRSLGLFAHGDMDQPARAMDTFVMHANTAGVLPLANREFSVLELGPGDSVFTALIARALGASRTWLVDAGDFATHDPKAYANAVAYLASLGLALPKLDVSDLNRMLEECGVSYLTDGVSSLAQIPAHSIDYCFSNAVLEHIPWADFERLAAELHRIMKPGGVCVHRVDLKDHLGGGLNNLRFSERIWESRLFRCSGFYTNRIRFGEMLSIFRKAGFVCEVPRAVMWDRLPISRQALAIPFRSIPDKDLCVSGFDLVLRRGMAS